MAVDASGGAVAEPPVGVGRTAVMVAAVRAIETRRTDRLFTDPYAVDFVTVAGFGELIADAGAPPDMSGAWQSFADYAPIRTRFFDDYLVDATRGIRQVVIVAAGLDTRVFRLPWSDEVDTYELDSAEVLAFKQQVLDGCDAHPHGRRVAVPVDLREEWTTPLLDAGFDPSRPSAWLVEGLVGYLTPAQNDRLLGEITAHCASGSMLSMEYLHVDAVAVMVTAMSDPAAEPVKALWRGGGIAEQAQPWLDRHGWTARVDDTYERAAAYGRELPPPGDSPMDRFAVAARRNLVVARRR